MEHHLVNLNPDSCQRQVSEITRDLIHIQNDDARLQSVANELYALLSKITGMNENSDGSEDNCDIQLPSGKAISPKSAARCTLDVKRTTGFLRGIYAAIVEAQKRFQARPIQILYAGCGPFAPFAISLTTLFAPNEIEFTLLDVHERSLEAAKRAFNYFDKACYVRDYVRCDAVSYRHPGDLHIVVVEAMQAALAREPQVAIALNLVSQLPEQGLLIPEKVTVDAYLADLNKEFVMMPVERVTTSDLPAEPKPQRTQIHLGCLIELTVSFCRNLKASHNDFTWDRRIVLSPVKVKIPPVAGDQLIAMLLTTITVFDGATIGDHESGLTSPILLYDLDRKSGDAEIEFRYVIGPTPGFEYQVVQTG